jgi:hypothetical protein
MKKKMTALILTGILVCSIVSGCESQETTEEATTELSTEIIIEEATAEDATPEEAEQVKPIGEPSENGFEVYLTNNTGKSIVELAIYDTDSDEYSDNLLDEDDEFLDGEERVLYYEDLSLGDESEEESEAEEEYDSEEGSDDTAVEKLLSIGYDIKLVFDDESEYVLHSFPFGEISTGSILIEDDVCFVEYDDYSTKEAELAIKEAEEAANSTQSNTSVTSTPATTAAQVTEAQVTEAQSSSQTNEVQSSDSQPVDTAPADSGSSDSSEVDVGDQGSENCIGDDALTY